MDTLARFTKILSNSFLDDKTSALDVDEILQGTEAGQLKDDHHQVSRSCQLPYRKDSNKVHNLVQVVKSEHQFDEMATQDRVVFVDVHSLHKSWRSIPSLILHESVLVFPLMFLEWILEPSMYLDHVPVPAAFVRVMSDDTFIKFLQWKYEQQRLFCIRCTSRTITTWNAPDKTTECAPVWRKIAQGFGQLSDPTSGGTYKPLFVDEQFYTSNRFRSRYNVSAGDICAVLKGTRCATIKILCEVIYQSNPALRIVSTSKQMVAIMAKTGLAQKKDRCVLAKLNSVVHRYGDDGLIEKEKQSMLDEVVESVLRSTSPQKRLTAAAGSSVIKLAEVEAPTLGMHGTHLDVLMEDETNWWFADDYTLEY